MAEAVGFGAAIDYLNEIGFDAIERYEHELAAYALDKLAELPWVKSYGPPADRRAGIVSFKLYFLVGLPGTRREEETEAIGGFLRRFRERVLGEARAAGRMGTITAVLSPFVPKPFTPLQWAGMAEEEEIRSREEAVASFVRSAPNLQWTGERPRDAVLQGYLGLSDRRVSEDLRRVKGGRLPASTPGLAQRIAAVVHREKSAGECFPWDVIDGGIRKGTLRARYEKYLKG
jgi:radical SAM superfamily enzyme YgiQ (UPF0313 family)